MAEPTQPRDKVERYVIMINDRRYGATSTAKEAASMAELAARDPDVAPNARVWTRVVGDGRLRAARAAARERYPDQTIRARLVSELSELSQFEIRARRPIAGGVRETIANLWISELGRPRWAGEPEGS